ncbi:hypothetical protein [uncultured Anaerococcus sp.]|uniref:hypothetical protein n=1 Tax=uncultured Anaerococcus sp. TaxID=293428 RepID=UPI00288C12C9|nr:hypothetical protein [uncultured Anaerococcus sp.]
MENQNNVKITFTTEKEKAEWNSLSEEDKKEWQLTANYLKEEWPDIVTGDSLSYWEVKMMNNSGM